MYLIITHCKMLCVTSRGAFSLLLEEQYCMRVPRGLRGDYHNKSAVLLLLPTKV